MSAEKPEQFLRSRKSIVLGGKTVSVGDYIKGFGTIYQDGEEPVVASYDGTISSIVSWAHGDKIYFGRAGEYITISGERRLFRPVYSVDKVIPKKEAQY